MPRVYEKKRYGPPGPRRKQIFTNEQLEKALRATRGIQSLAIKALEKATGVLIDRSTISKCISKSKRLQAVVEESREEFVDFGELQLYKGVANGDSSLIRFLLETQGKNRGYTRRTELVRAEPENIERAELHDARERNLSLIAAISKRLASRNPSEAGPGGPARSLPPYDQTRDGGVPVCVEKMVGEAEPAGASGRVVQLARDGRPVFRENSLRSGVDKRTG